MSDFPRVVLSPQEMHIAAMVGVMRQVENIGKGRQHAHGASSANGWQMHIDGAIGEAAIAKWAGKYWNGNLGDLDADDVGRLQVRYTIRDDGRLILHKSDPDDRAFILVTGAQPTLTLRGWIWARDGKREEFWQDPRTGRPAYFVPQSALKPMKPRQTP